MRRAGDVYLLCYRARVPAGKAALLLRDRLLLEWHDDQVNIVQVHRDGRQRTHLFTRDAASIDVLAR